MNKISPKIKNETVCSDEALKIDFGDLIKIKLDSGIEKELKIYCINLCNID